MKALNDFQEYIYDHKHLICDEVFRVYMYALKEMYDAFQDFDRNIDQALDACLDQNSNKLTIGSLRRKKRVVRRNAIKLIGFAVQDLTIELEKHIKFGKKRKRENWKEM